MTNSIQVKKKKKQCFRKWALWIMLWPYRPVIFQSREDELPGLFDVVTCVRQTGCHSAVNRAQEDISIWFG